ncbi:MAG TPA: DUF2520 domain-containing protein [Thermoanaerobaculia bacterium]|nr:DUF2520 domain-containing protein [Thermoanaerobaculia bacterium]
MKPKNLPSVTLVGHGRAGRAFERSWVAAGGRVAEIVGRTLQGHPLAGEILIVAVPDDEIANAAAFLAGAFRGRAAYHLSGALPAGILAPLAASGVSLGSLHPARVFTGARSENWKGAFVAVEGEGPAVLEGEGFVKALGGIPRRITASAKPLYHLAAALAAGGTASLIALATRAWQEAGIPSREARPALAALSRQAASAAAARDFEVILTGPIARRDVGTVALHARALESQEALRSLYRILAEEILERTPGRGREGEIRALLGLPERSRRSNS